MSSSEIQYGDLVNSIKEIIDSNGDGYVNGVEAYAKPILTWVSYLSVSHSRSVCDELLSGVVGSVREVAAYLSLGLGRSALFSMRSQMEQMIAWLYYNEHHIEWGVAQRNPSKFKMRAEFLKSFKENYEKFERRMAILDLEAGRGKDFELYSILSAHIHSTSYGASPKVDELKNIVKSKEYCQDCLKLQGYVSLYLSDICVSLYADDWYDLPDEVHVSLKGRLKADDLKKLLS